MIDLHIHTTFSDGTDTYEEILKKAQEKIYHIFLLQIIIIAMYIENWRK